MADKVVDLFLGDYEGDPRIEVHENREGVTVHRPGGRDIYVLHALGWGLFEGPNLNMVFFGNSGLDAAWQIRTAEDAIALALEERPPSLDRK